MTPPASDATQTLIPGGSFLMGSDHHYPEEGPVREMKVAPFWMDTEPVTNRQFAEFAASTGHITAAETVAPSQTQPENPDEEPQAGSLVFTMSPGPVDLGDFRNWWKWTPGADWRHPAGPGSGLDGLEDHPVVHIAHSDAEAYARWSGGQLPTEAEWEFAARGGLDGAEFVWGGQDYQQTDSPRANTWQGRFPYESADPHGWVRTSPAGFYPANGYGLYDMAGNVWEWTSDRYVPGLPSATENACCAPARKREPARPAAQVIKGGSHLCTIQYCFRYRPAARQALPANSSSGHVGFRCITRSRP